MPFFRSGQASQASQRDSSSAWLTSAPPSLTCFAAARVKFQILVKSGGKSPQLPHGSEAVGIVIGGSGVADSVKRDSVHNYVVDKTTINGMG